MRDYQKLDIWKKAHSFTLQVYQKILPLMPSEEKFALTQQIRRAAYSIPLNIVEGSRKNTDKDFTHYLDNALGSTKEVEYAFILIKDLGYISEEDYLIVYKDINEIKAMLIAFIKFLRKGQDSQAVPSNLPPSTFKP
ncbi:four helix bundle protein [Pedobacter sp. BS3]|uniref:four helix bundle protein n=1 Tax=Pedobacter sp. BS3 TaxID=2567937 RepID=UPI0011EDF8E1|nr:four helix bundle protein [Pedobacter sp. BS3]TZF81707.1 four helix bundle protein [Pedobacter sp. BS3]